MTPPRARTWGRRGNTPVIRGRSRRRISVAALCCYKPGQNSRLIHRPRSHLPLTGARKRSGPTPSMAASPRQIAPEYTDPTLKSSVVEPQSTPRLGGMGKCDIPYRGDMS